MQTLYIETCSWVYANLLCGWCVWYPCALRFRFPLVKAAGAAMSLPLAVLPRTCFGLGSSPESDSNKAPKCSTGSLVLGLFNEELPDRKRFGSCGGSTFFITCLMFLFHFCFMRSSGISTPMVNLPWRLTPCSTSIDALSRFHAASASSCTQVIRDNCKATNTIN